MLIDRGADCLGAPGQGPWPKIRFIIQDLV